MNDIQQRQAPIDLAIAKALIAATPSSWAAADMTVSREVQGEKEKMTIIISSSEGRKEVVVPTEEIYSELYRLSDLFIELKVPWAGAVYSISVTDQGKWKYTAQFKYN